MLLTLFLIILGTSVIWVPALLIYLFVRGTRSKPEPAPISQLNNDDRDREWTEYISSFQAVATSKKEQALLAALLSGASSESYGSGHVSASNQQSATEAWTAPSLSGLPAEPNQAPIIEPAPVREPIDNTLLLLYFGAFLLVASVGLFVALGGLPGIVRTFIVAATAAVLYFGGLKLYIGNEKLAAAGISFVGSGMIIAPLTGVAYFNLVADKQFGGVVWLVTSLACIALYINAYQRIRNDFTAYLLIGSFVSTVESSVLTIGLPTYGYAWGLTVVGIALVLTSRSQKSVMLDRSAATSASLLVPLSILGSLFLLPEFGNIQLAITLLLAGVYYGLLSVQQSADRKQFRMAAQSMVLAAIANIVYAVEPSFVAVGVVLTGIAVAYVAAIALSKETTKAENGLMEIATALIAIALVCSITSAWALVGGLVVAGLLAAVIWLQQMSDEALQALGVIILALPFVIGLYALKLDLDSSTLLAFTAGSVLVITAIMIDTIRNKHLEKFYYTTASLFWTAVAACLLPAILIGSGQVVGVVAIVAALCVLLRKLSDDTHWLVGGCLVVLIPIVYAVFGQGYDTQLFSLAVLAALAWNIGVSLLTREASIRWIVVLLILVTPIALGAGGLGLEWESYGYSIGYMLATLSCVMARAIARGKLLVSFKVPITSYYTAASQAYVFGYCAAGLIALALSLDTADSRVLTTALLGVVGAVIVLLAKVERNPEIIALLPAVAQLVIFSALRPAISDGEQLGYAAVVSTAVAALCYWLGIRGHRSVRQIALGSAYVGPGLAFLQSDVSLLLPVCLLVAGLLTVHYTYATSQQNRELSIAVCFAAIHWFLYLSGVENIHIHTHVAAGFLAAFAFWRYSRGDRLAYDNYIRAIFFVITVPLILSSLYDEAGSVYGLILIGEQVVFMLAGVTLPPDSTGRRFLLRYGLWTALAAILFQLRGLGWAFLSLLAIIVIAVAVYRLQKTPPKP